MKIVLYFLYLFYAVSLCYNLSTISFNGYNKLYKNNIRLRRPLLSKSSARLELPNNSSTNIFHNSNSYYNKNKIISNLSNDIDKIYLSYNNNYSLIIYKNGYIEENLNRSLKVKQEQDVLELHMVSMKYFCKLYNDLCLRNGTNKTQMQFIENVK